MSYIEKLSAIRQQMKTDGVAAYIIPSADPHISEYLPSHYKCTPFTTGFTGSAATVVITEDFAGVWTDARYFEQAEEQLAGSGFELVKLKVQQTPEYIQWLSEQLPHGANIAFDEKLVSIVLGELLHKQLAHLKPNLQHKDYLSPIWENRPALPSEPAFLIAAEFTGKAISEKLTEVRKAMKRHHANYHLISSLDDMAWLFNMRGADVSYNPVVLSFALITLEQATLYIQPDKLTAEDKYTLAKNGVEILSYDTIANDLQAIPQESTILIDPKRNCFALYKLIPAAVHTVLEINPSTALKASKNETEIKNTRTAMVKDGVAITQFLKWVKENVDKIEITEIAAAAQLKSFRAAQDGFIGESFNTIAAYKAHGALPHYGATKESNVAIKAEGLFLVDSGGQYRYGTTDITRVIPMGNNTEEEKTDYTLVLKAMIEGCKTRFPKGTCGYQIDAITRRPLWDFALNYGHGTGHGVGYFLNVHEGPQVFNATATAVPVELGMITSIEPGIYRSGKHGIRIENLVLTISDQSNEFNEFYAFEALTLAPIDTTLVKKELLEQSHIKWLNQYHANVYAKLSPYLNEEEKVFLGRMTSEI
ncbi:aminopeptidase P family protein [Pedobacter polaris]|uniref:Aminopeptidase P family protein n=1 Tax=Pedobacter polaris TaxID=2571273 RepID=A0A4V5NZ20_9SPHI|nr:aminopeptidase P family protein [Pedobacter polaris]TKC06476.1 aminopeptidase P family protein [Pedobacter polaris]